MSHLSELFSDFFARQDNFLTRIDPRTKLIVALAVLIAVLFSTTPFFPLIVLVLCFTAMVVIGMPTGMIGLRLASPMGIAAVLVVLKSVMTGSTPLWSVDLLGMRIIATHEGLQTGLQIAARVLGSMSAMLLLSSVTPAHRLFHALRAMGMPRGWVEIALLMYRYIFTLVDLVADMIAAQKLRLGYSGVACGLSSTGLVAGTVILRSVDQAVRTHEAMRLRGYHGDIPFGPMPPLKQRDWEIMGAAIFLLAGVVLFTERIGG